MFRSLILAAVLLAAGPLVANAGEITLLPSVKLQIGDRDNYGNYWDGGSWRDRDYCVVTMNGVITVGIVMTTAGTKAGTKAEIKPGSAAIVLAGTTAMTTAAAGDAARVGAVTVMDMAITNKRKGEPIGSPLLYSASGIN